MLSFYDFISERREVERRKRGGQARPWTNDSVLHETRITNLNRNFDRGTIRLREKVEALDDIERIRVIVLYRSGYSSPFLLESLTGLVYEDTQWLQSHKHGFGDRLPYQVTMVDGQHIGEFLIKSCFDVAQFIHSKLLNYRCESLQNVAEDIATRFRSTHAFRMIFLGTEIAKDLSIFYPKQVDPLSRCPINSGARSGLARLHTDNQIGHIWRINDRMDYLKAQTGMSFSELEHALCEFDKYRFRWEEYCKPEPKIPRQWLYEPNEKPLYSFDLAISA